VKLTNVSRYPGITMNYPVGATDTSPDMDFGAGDTELFGVPIPKGGAPKVVKLPLYINDYGAWATIEVTMPYRKTTFVTRRAIPSDSDGNRLPDGGWTTSSGNISSHSLLAEEDFDAIPVGLPPPADGLIGDGLTAFEEYRGFIVAGQYQRLDPSRKDLFIVADVEALVPPANAMAVLTKLPQRLHYLDKTEAAMASGQVKPVINPNRLGIAQATEQRAVRIREQNAPPIYHRNDPGDDTPAELMAAGYTWVDAEDLNVINDPSQYPIETPNKTQVVEYYPAAFRNFAIAFGPNGVFESTTDSNGDPIVVCNDPVNDIGCVAVDHTNKLAHKPPKELRLLAVTGGDDYYTKIAFDGCFPFLARRVMTAAEFQSAHTAVVGHETGHALRVPHTTSCLDLMYTEVLASPPGPSPTGMPNRITVIDVLPIVLDYSPPGEQRMRLHANQ
jgi:hypothetical protein